MKSFIMTAALLSVTALSACTTATHNSPHSEYTQCPKGERPEMCTMIYKPVCGYTEKEVQCVTEPCLPLLEPKKTYSSDCTACSNKDITAYTDGECTETKH